MDAAALEALKQKNPGRELVELSGKYATVVAKIPNLSEYQAFRLKIEDKQPEVRAAAMEWLVRLCVLSPDPKSDEFNALIAKRPILIPKWGDQLTDLAGADEVVAVSKL